MSKIDAYDIMLFMGVLLLGASIYMFWGVAAAMAYAGLFLMLIGLIGARAT